MSPLEREILLLLSQQADPVRMDYVAIYTLLNTVSGGHYQERYSEADINSALFRLASIHAIRESQIIGSTGIWEPQTVFTITDSGRSSLLR